MMRVVVLFFFFFQAEDGIRDVAVTGVQTCALPISIGERETFLAPFVFPATRPGSREDNVVPGPGAAVAFPATRGRSEEHTSELQSRLHLVCRLLLEKKKKDKAEHNIRTPTNKRTDE